MFLDIHTHKSECCDNVLSVVNTDALPSEGGGCFSVGLHPWAVDCGWRDDFERISLLAADARVVAIGECGVDKLRGGANVDVQVEVLRAHIRLSEKLEKPLVLHCVKGADEILALHRAEKPSQAWVIHAFRGKPSQAVQLLREGLYLSFGEFFNREALAVVPLDRVFVESDMSDKGIEVVYASVAEALGVEPVVLAARVLCNAKRCNFSLPCDGLNG